MRAGGICKLASGEINARLLMALSGPSRYPTGCWYPYQQRVWVINCLHHGHVRMRMGAGKPFIRPSGQVDLYAPGTRYSEWREHEEVNHSFILFRLSGLVEGAFRAMTGSTGYCHLQDPDKLLGEGLQKLGLLLHERRPGYELLVHGEFLTLLGHVAASSLVRRGIRVASRDARAADPPGLLARVEDYVRIHIAEPISVAELARHLGISSSALAHAYPSVSGESPHRTIVRLKIEAAKRLILEDGLNVKQCADRLGFSSQFQFSRVFKRLEGVAPQFYRQRLSR